MVKGLNILCAGRGEGKTTFLCDHVAQVVRAGLSVGGVGSPAVFEDGRRVGYDLLDLRTGKRRSLARVVENPRETPTVGMYRFDSEAIAEGNTAIIAAVKDRCSVVAIDEVGPLEMQGGGWSRALAYALANCGLDQELIIVIRPSLVDELPRSFPSPLWSAANRVSPPWPAPARS